MPTMRPSSMMANVTELLRFLDVVRRQQNRALLATQLLDQLVSLRRACGSSPADGSSRKSICGSLMRASASRGAASDRRQPAYPRRVSPTAAAAEQRVAVHVRSRGSQTAASPRGPYAIRQFVAWRQTPIRSFTRRCRSRDRIRDHHVAAVARPQPSRFTVVVLPARSDRAGEHLAGIDVEVHAFDGVERSVAFGEARRGRWVHAFARLKPSRSIIHRASVSPGARRLQPSVGSGARRLQPSVRPPEREGFSRASVYQKCPFGIFPETQTPEPVTYYNERRRFRHQRNGSLGRYSPRRVRISRSAGAGLSTCE